MRVVHPFYSSETRRRGMTLVELMISMVIMALIGVTVATMLSAVAYATSDAQDVGGMVAQRKMVSSRIEATVRGAQQVLDLQNDYVVLWIEDTDEDGLADDFETRTLVFDSDAGTLTSIEAEQPADDSTPTGNGTLADILDTLGVSDGSADSRAITETWADNVGSWQVTANATPATSARLLSYRLTLTVNTHTESVIGAVMLRNEYE